MNLFRINSMVSDILTAWRLEGLPYKTYKGRSGNQVVSQELYTLTGKTKNFTVKISLYYTNMGRNSYTVWVTDYKGVEIQVAKSSFGFFSIIDFPHQKEIVDFIHNAKKEIKHAEKLKTKKQKELEQKKEEERLHSLSVK